MNFHRGIISRITYAIPKSLVFLFLTSMSSLFVQLTLGVGAYGGMYIAQNYDVPKVDEPEKIFEKVQKLFGDAKKEVEEAKRKADK